MEVLLTKKDMAERLGEVSEATVNKLLRKGLGPPAFKLNGRVLCREDEFEKWLLRIAKEDADPRKPANLRIMLNGRWYSFHEDINGAA